MTEIKRKTTTERWKDIESAAETLENRREAVRNLWSPLDNHDKRSRLRRQRQMCIRGRPYGNQWKTIENLMETDRKRWGAKWVKIRWKSIPHRWKPIEIPSSTLEIHRKSIRNHRNPLEIHPKSRGTHRGSLWKSLGKLMETNGKLWNPFGKPIENDVAPNG